MAVLQTLAGAVLGAGLGVQLFLSFLLAPASFRLIDRALAVRLMEGIFPGYYGFGLVATVLALACAVPLAARERTALRWGVVAVLAVTLLGTVYAGQVLLPEAHAARLRAQAARAGDLAPLEFSRLHRLAVAVNIAVFLVGALGLALHALAGASAPGASGGRASARRAGSP